MPSNASALAYERARFSEALPLPAAIYRLLVGTSLVVGVIASVLLLVLGRRLPMRSAWLVLLGPGVAAAALAATLTAHGLIQVFADRLEVSLFVYRLRIKRFIYRWPQVKSLEIAGSAAGGGYSVYQWSPGFERIMFGSHGIRLELDKGRLVMIGSGDPDRLLEAIEQARKN